MADGFKVNTLLSRDCVLHPESSLVGVGNQLLLAGIIISTTPQPWIVCWSILLHKNGIRDL